jgi:hypothetical protein
MGTENGDFHSLGNMDYLEHAHIPNLVEWFTSEAMINLPDDPLHFLKDKLGDVIEKVPFCVCVFLPVYYF